MSDEKLNKGGGAAAGAALGMCVGGPFGALIGGGIGYLLGFGKMVDGAVGLAGAAANKALNDEKCLMNMDADQIGKCVDAAVAAEQWKEYRGKK